MSSRFPTVQARSVLTLPGFPGGPRLLRGSLLPSRHFTRYFWAGWSPEVFGWAVWREAQLFRVSCICPSSAGELQDRFNFAHRTPLSDIFKVWRVSKASECRAKAWCYLLPPVRWKLFLIDYKIDLQSAWEYPQTRIQRSRKTYVCRLVCCWQRKKQRYLII